MMKVISSLRLWWIITLSGLLYSGSFLAIRWPLACSSMMAMALFFLFYFFYFCKRTILFSPRTIGIYGLWWGFLVFTLHFAWLPFLLATKSCALVWQIVVLYAATIFYFSLTASLWFVITSHLVYLVKKIKWNLCPIIIFICFYSIILFWERYAWWFLGTIEGYPFISPFIPLVRIPYILAVVFGMSSMVNGPATINHHITDTSFIGYIRPPAYSNKVALSQYLFHQIDQLQTRGKSFLVTPESFYKFPINEDKETICLLTSSLNKKTQLLLGSYFVKKDKWYQAAYLCNDKGVQQIYAKRHAVSFVEKMPLYVRDIQWLRNIFLSNRKEFAPKMGMGFSDGVFGVAFQQQGVVRLCSEVFFTNVTNDFLRYYKNNSKLNTLLFFLINDSWFVDYFKKMMETVCHITAACSGLPVCYVGFQECVILLPNGGRKLLHT